MTETIHGTKVDLLPAVQEKAMQRIGRVLRSGRLTLGPNTGECERMIGAAAQRGNCTLVSSCTAGFALLWDSLVMGGLKRVTFQANAFPSPAFEANRAGIHVRQCGIVTPTLAPNVQILDALTWEKDGSEALVIMHTCGIITPEIIEIGGWCKENNVILIEDCAHALGSRVHDRPAGSFGEFALFSFHAPKTITGGEGGAICSVSQAQDTRFRAARNYGKALDFGQAATAFDGFSVRMSELNAALLRSHLEWLDDIIRLRQAIVDVYERQDQGVLQLVNPSNRLEAAADERDHVRTAWYKVPVMPTWRWGSLDLHRTFRVELRKRCTDDGIYLAQGANEVDLAGHAGGEFCESYDSAFGNSQFFVSAHLVMPVHESLEPLPSVPKTIWEIVTRRAAEIKAEFDAAHGDGDTWRSSAS